MGAWDARLGIDPGKRTYLRDNNMQGRCYRSLLWPVMLVFAAAVFAAAPLTAETYTTSSAQPVAVDGALVDSTGGKVFSGAQHYAIFQSGIDVHHSQTAAAPAGAAANSSQHLRDSWPGLGTTGQQALSYLVLSHITLPLVGDVPGSDVQDPACLQLHVSGVSSNRQEALVPGSKPACAPVQQEVCLGAGSSPADGSSSQQHHQGAHMAVSLVCAASIEWLHVQLFQAKQAVPLDPARSSQPAHSILAWSRLLPAKSSVLAVRLHAEPATAALVQVPVLYAGTPHAAALAVSEQAPSPQPATTAAATAAGDVLAAAWQQQSAAAASDADHSSNKTASEHSLQALVPCPCSRRSTMDGPGAGDNTMPTLQVHDVDLLCGKPEWQLHMCSRLADPAGLVNQASMTSHPASAWHVQGAAEQQQQQQKEEPAACVSSHCRFARSLQLLLQAYPAPAAWAMVGLAACNLLLLVNQFRQPKQGIHQEMLPHGQSTAAAGKQPEWEAVHGTLPTQQRSSPGLAVAAHLQLPADPAEEDGCVPDTEPFASAWMAAPPLKRPSAAAAQDQQGMLPRRRSSAAAAVMAAAAAASKLKAAMQAHYSRPPAVAEQQLEEGGRAMSEVGEDTDAGWTRDIAGRLIRAMPWTSDTPGQSGRGPSMAAAASSGRPAGTLAAAGAMPGSTGRSREMWQVEGGFNQRDQGPVVFS